MVSEIPRRHLFTKNGRRKNILKQYLLKILDAKNGTQKKVCCGNGMNLQVMLTSYKRPNEMGNVGNFKSQTENKAFVVLVYRFLISCGNFIPINSFLGCCFVTSMNKQSPALDPSESLAC